MTDGELNPYEPNTYNWFVWRRKNSWKTLKTGTLIKNMSEAVKADENYVGEIEDELNFRFSKLDTGKAQQRE